MRKIITIILLLICSGSFGQYKANDDKFISNTDGSASITGDWLYEYPHAFFSKRDTLGFTLLLTQNIWTSLDVAGMIDLESHGINKISGDTIQYQQDRACHIDIRVFINGTTANANDDVWISVTNTRTGFVTYGYGLSAGSGGYSSWRINEYDIDCQYLDKYVIHVRNKTNNNDLTIYAVTVDFNVRHFE
jgi:hypothetical protein